MKNISSQKNLFIILLLAVVSAAVRLYINFSTEYMPGAVGAFYLVQVRSIIETGSLAFKEFPLIFYLEAAVAKMIIIFGSVNTDLAVDTVSRIFDAVIPPLSIFPAYFLTKNIFDKKQNKWLLVLFSSFSVFYISFFTLVSDYQKNSLGLLWLFFLLLFVYKSFRDKKSKDYFYAFLFFALTGITHFGTFAVAIFFLLIVFTINYFKLFSVKRLVRFVVELAAVLILGLGTVYFFSPIRFVLLVKAPSEIFNDPIFLSLFSGKPIISPIDILNIIFINIIALAALVIFVRHRRKIDDFKNVYTVSSIITCFLLASPFLGIEWGQRLYLISYVFVLPLLIFLYEETGNNIFKSLIVVAAILVLTGSIITTIFTPQVSNMSKEGYKELIEMKNNLSEKGSSIIIAKLGLSYWISWTQKTMVGQEVDIRKHWWNSIDNIYFLKQVKGSVPFGSAGLYGRPFSDPKIPRDADIVFTGEYYKLYRINKPPDYLTK